MCHDLSLDITCYLQVPRFIFRYTILSTGATLFSLGKHVICRCHTLSLDTICYLQVSHFIHLCQFIYSYQYRLCVPHIIYRCHALSFCTTNYLYVQGFIFRQSIFSTGAMLYTLFSRLYTLPLGARIYLQPPHVCRCHSLSLDTRNR